jgi:hypothetical protein
MVQVIPSKSGVGAVLMVGTQSSSHTFRDFHLSEKESYFSDLETQWWEQPFYTQIVKKIRITGKDGNLRPIAIVTSGPISRPSIDSLELELGKAKEVTGVALPSGSLSWHALNHELCASESAEITGILDRVGAEFIIAGEAHVGDDKTSNMYDARAAVQTYIQRLEGDPIICWLDSDLEFSTLVANEDELKVNQPWPWVHMVWDQWLNGERVDIAIGDVTGDPPIPASSTILTNLRDLAQKGEVANGSRWSIRDPAYDLSEIAKPDVLFPQCNGNWPSQLGIVESILWKGTLNRPLVASEEILSQPHRPWFVRGGLTVIYNREAMYTSTPRFNCMGFTARRGDSYWLVYNIQNMGFTVGNFPFPLLHCRGELNIDRVELIRSFRSRFFGDFFGAASLKGTVSSLNSNISALGENIHSAISARAARSKEVLELALAELKVLNGAISPTGSATIERALIETLSELSGMDLKQVGNELYLQIAEYLEVESNE